jgi:hypothetical protein
MSYRVILVIAADGTQSIVGTPNGQPFTSKVSAERTAAKYVNHEMGVDATVLEIEPGER